MESVDADYRVLRERGHAGWGGAKFRSRLKGRGREIDFWRRETLIAAAPAFALELGCGNGAISTLLARRGYRVSGVDISTEAIDWARSEFRRRNLRGDFFVCDLTSRLPSFDDASFDLIIDGNCLHCICSADRRAQVLAGAHRLSHPNGRFVVSSMCGEPRSLEAGDVFDRERRLLVRDGEPHRYMASVDELMRELTAAGFFAESSRVRSNRWWDHVWLIAKRVA
ncbi:MAG: putative S-adenosylmethionine-dependent methyltransferase/MSMEI [bacterium]|nr:putative S-adenosylmethionine-dependent methyltransferase/MSMEI [bacterium]